MSVSNYGQLKTAVANWLARDNLTAFIPDLIEFASDRINREFRIRQMEESFDSTISAGTIPLPDGYLFLKHAYVDVNPTQWLERKPAEHIYKLYPNRSSEGIPKIIGSEGEFFIFGPYPDSSYDIKGIYYKEFDTFTIDSDTNWLLENNPSVYLFAALAESEAFDKNDERIELWESKYEIEKARVITADAQEKFSGSGLAMRAY